jgi:hypothetical protein
VRIAPNYYSIDDAEAIKTIYGHGTQFTKARWYVASASVEKPGDYPNMFTELNPTVHADGRRKVASLYAMSSLVPMEQNAVDCAKLLSGKLNGFAERNEAFNLQGEPFLASEICESLKLMVNT